MRVSREKILPKVPWLRVILSALMQVFIILTAMSSMLFYRLLHLPLALNQFCPPSSADIYCIASVTEQLIYANQWLAIQFIVYFLLSIVLWPIFSKAVGLPMINLLLVGFISTVCLMLLLNSAGIEFFASALCPLFIGLLISAKRKRQIVINN